MAIGFEQQVHDALERSETALQSGDLATARQVLTDVQAVMDANAIAAPELVERFRQQQTDVTVTLVNAQLAEITELRRTAVDADPYYILRRYEQTRDIARDALSRNPSSVVLQELVARTTASRDEWNELYGLVTSGVQAGHYKRVLEYFHSLPVDSLVPIHDITGDFIGNLPQDKAIERIQLEARFYAQEKVAEYRDTASKLLREGKLGEALKALRRYQEIGLDEFLEPNDLEWLKQFEAEIEAQFRATRTGHLYISYPYADGQNTAERLQEALEKSGYTTWRDVTNIPALGTEGYASEEAFWAESEQAMARAAYLLVIISPAVSENPNSGVRREMEMAQRLGVPIIPLRLKQAALPESLADVEPIDFDRFNNGMTRLLKVLPPASALRTDDYRAIPDPDDLPNVNLDNVGNVSNSLAPRKKAAPRQQQQATTPSATPRTGHLYISYPYRDGREHADALQQRLMEIGYPTWRDVTDWPDREGFWVMAERAMVQASYLLAIYSPAVEANPDGGVQRELRMAEAAGVPIIVLLIGEATRPIGIQLHAVVEFDNVYEGMSALFGVLPAPETLTPDLTNAINLIQTSLSASSPQERERMREEARARLERIIEADPLNPHALAWVATLTFNPRLIKEARDVAPNSPSWAQIEVFLAASSDETEESVVDIAEGQPIEQPQHPLSPIGPFTITSGTPVRVGARELAVTAIMQREDEAVLVLYGGFTNRDAEVVAENGDLIGEIIEQSSGFSIARLRGTRPYSAALPNGEPLRGVAEWSEPRPLVISTTGEDITITRMADRYESDQRWAWTVGQLDRFTGLPEGTLLLDRDDGRASAVLVGGAANLKTAIGDNYVPLSWAVDDFGLAVIDDVTPFPAPDTSLPVVEEPLPLDPAEIHIGTPCRVGDEELVVSAMVMQGEQARLLLVTDAPVGTRVYASNGDLIGEVIAQQTYFAIAKLAGSRTFAAVLPNGHPLEGWVGMPIGNSPYDDRNVFLTLVGTGERIALVQRAQRGGRERTSTLSSFSSLSQMAPFVELGEASRVSPMPPAGTLLLHERTRVAHAVVVESGADGAARLTFIPIQWAIEDLDLTLITTPDRYRVKQTAADTLRATRDRIGVDDEDRLGVTPYVTAFERLVRDTDPPLTVGIYGKWGSGKTFIMNQVALRLNPTWKRKERPQRRKVISLPRLRVAPLPTDLHPLIVWFEAWDYIVTDKLWSGLLERVFHELENAEGIDAWQQFRLNVKRNWERQRLRGRARLWPLVIAASLAAVVVGSLSQILETTLAQVGGLTVVGAATLIGLANTLLTSASQRVSELFTSADYRNDLNFMGNIRDDLQAFAASLPNGMKVAVFIDDLDRCDPKKAVEVLEAVKLLLDFDHSPFMVFMGLDARIITQAIEQHYGEVLSEARITGYEYLDKIVQIPFSIPEPRPEDLRDYLGSLVNLGKHETRSANGSQPPTPVDAPPAPDAAPPPPPPIETPFVASAPDLSANNIGMPAMNMTDSQKAVPAPVAALPTDEPQAVDEPAPIMQGPAYSQREADFFDDEVSQEVEEEVVQQVVDEPAPEPEAPAAPPSPQELEDTVAFTAPEQQAFMSFNPHIDPNPRRIKRLVNVYRLVRVLLKVQPPDVPLDPSQQAMWVMGWLTLCEQWPFAAHCMLETLPEIDADANLLTLYNAAHALINKDGTEQLRRLDLEYDRLAAMIEDRLADMTCEHLLGLRRYTVNFNPALSAEVRLTLMMAE